MVPLRNAAALALCLVLSAAGGKDLPPPPALASLAVRAGRATLVQGEKIDVLTRVSPRSELSGAAYAEVGPRSELEVSWPGSGSLRVSGPAALEWENAGEVHVLRAERIEFEMRRGSRRLYLPGGWSVAVQRGALSASERTSGDWIVENRGGVDAALYRGSKRAGVLTSGAWVLLPVAAPPR